MLRETANDSGTCHEENSGVLTSESSSEDKSHGTLESVDSDIPPADAIPKVPESEYLEGFKLFAVLGAVTLTAFLMLLDTSVVVTAIPQITTHFGSTDDIGWYGSAYLLCNCAIQPLGGKIYKHFPPKMTFLMFLALFELGSLICGLANSSNMLIIGRAVAGMGGAGIVTGVLTILASSVTISKRPLMMGILMGIANLGTAAGPLVGGALTEYLNWRYCFFINLPCGVIVAAILLLIHVPGNNSMTSRKGTFLSTIQTLDLWGFITFAPAIIMFLLALGWGGTVGYPWNSATIIGLFAGSVGMFAVFLSWEHRRGDTAMVPLAIFNDRVVTAGCLVQLFLMGNMMVTIYYLPVWFQAILGESPTSSGIHITPLVGSQILTSVGGGILITMLGFYLPFGIFGLGLAAIGTGLLATFTPSTPIASWVCFQILTGLRGMALQIPILAVQNHLPKESIAIGNSMLVFTQNFGGTIFLALAELVFSHTLSASMKTYAPGVDSASILSWGATGFREHFTDEELPGILMAYDKSVVATFYLGAGAASVACLCSAFLGWKSVKKPKVQSKA